jgi:hypothetical protein
LANLEKPEETTQAGQGQHEQAPNDFGAWYKQPVDISLRVNLVNVFQHVFRSSHRIHSMG